MLLRITVVVTSPRVAPGVLTAPAWDLLRRVPVLTAAPAHPQLAALRAAGASVVVVAGHPAAGDLAEVDLAAFLRDVLPDPAATEVAWLPDPSAPTPLDRLLDRLVRPRSPADAGAAAPPAVGVVVDTLAGTAELPGSILLDAVAVMDRLRSPGGCPWDAEQTHESLAPYLIEETYEAYQAIEDGDLAELREELGDVLMQVLFHARIAAERAGDGWDVDDVAAGLVAKLIRRHPHVFADVVVDGAANVAVNWEAIKAVEKGRASVTEGVALSQPALTLAAKLLKRASGIGVPADLALAGGTDETGDALAQAGALAGASDVAAAGDMAAAGEVAGTGDVAGTGGVAEAGERVAAIAADALAALGRPGVAADDVVGDLLVAAVALARAVRVDPELALRTSARRFRDRLAAAERAARVDGAAPGVLPGARWRELWVAPAGPGDRVTPDG
ncbi:nucleoside triphosphate pyrophosphohydrolase [Frankia sp. AiPs1]|uniref:nucleoside triphosphate pyrophosphohydrolase n=1 Tax=Frankia sp. AiPs1 TaxID=573493 RepID=UPI0020433D55|nr:nucleoside triphosphate pyrophosphohydrolase [Frankia sp. AiPs1]MCM3924405.1 nucleoside triphosphate pyrophosphohydrolase [Frankia sp. AiPs1]